MLCAVRDTVSRLLAGACLAAAMAGVPAAQPRPADCKLEAAGSGTIRAVLDARTLALGDGRQVQLAGIEPPGAAGHPAVAAGRAALGALLAGGEVRLKRLGGEDRHGRLHAYVFAGNEARSLQEIMLGAGHARVGTHAGGAGCAVALFTAERAARQAQLGLWADPAHTLRQASDPTAVLAERGRFMLVEGRVLSVRESGGTIYVNFGRRWSEDFTVTVLKRGERAFTAAGLSLKALAGRTVRVRGIIEERGGPWIEARHPEQIELAD